MGGFWSNAGSSLIGSVGSVFGGVFGSSSARKDAEIAYERQKEFAQNRHQWEVEDLRKAGLNPVLTATGGSGAMAPAVGMANSAEHISKATQGVTNALGLRAMESAIKLNSAKKQESEAQANFLRGQNERAADMHRFNLFNADAQGKVLDATFDHLILQQGMTAKQIHKIEADTKLVNAQVETEATNVMKSLAQVGLIKEQEKLTQHQQSQVMTDIENSRENLRFLVQTRTTRANNLLAEGKVKESIAEREKLQAELIGVQREGQKLTNANIPANARAERFSRYCDGLTKVLNVTIRAGSAIATMGASEIGKKEVNNYYDISKKKSKRR